MRDSDSSQFRHFNVPTFKNPTLPHSDKFCQNKGTFFSFFFFLRTWTYFVKEYRDSDKFKCLDIPTRLSFDSLSLSVGILKQKLLAKSTVVPTLQHSNNAECHLSLFLYLPPPPLLCLSLVCGKHAFIPMCHCAHVPLCPRVKH